MKKENQKKLYEGMGLLIAFSVWTALIQLVDVRAFGPDGSAVGFAVVNQFIHHLTGVDMRLYTITDWLGLVPLGFVMGFALLGLRQWIKRKHLLNVDGSLLVLGGFYLAVIAVYCFFEMVPVNFRPVLINGKLEASYPSSTTMLVLCVMPTAIMQLRTRIRSRAIRRCVTAAIILFMAFMVIGRLLAGVHWITDIIGGVLLSAGFVKLYQFAVTGLPISGGSRE